MDDFFWRALLGGVGVAAMAGPLGSVIVWRRMAFFGDALSHGALLGIGLAVASDIAPGAGVLAVSVLLALAIGMLGRLRDLPGDALLGIVAPTALALGMIALAMTERARVDILAYLFGDILAIGPADILWIWSGGAAILIVLAILWRFLLALALHEELARVEGVPVDWVRAGFALLVALAVALTMKIVGALLVTALLVIPAATARRFSRSPEAMAAGAAAIGIAAVCFGLAASARWDLPTGPAVVAAAAALFLLGLLRPRGGVARGR